MANVNAVEAFDRVQAFKEENAHAEIPHGIVEDVREALTKVVGDLISSDQMEGLIHKTLTGMNWICAMAVKNDIPIEDLMVSCTRLAEASIEKMGNVEAGVLRGVEIGLGAGYFTGIGVGMDIQRQREA